MSTDSSKVVLPKDKGGGGHTSATDRVFYISFWVLFFLYTFVIMMGDMVLLPSPSEAWCDATRWRRRRPTEYPNPDSPGDPCYYERTAYLLGMNMFECDFGRRILCSVLLGGIIGYERKVNERPAGIRTMGLVCLGACLFTMCGQFAFRSSTQEWDAARVSAAIPSGVGFLGSALIFKDTTTNEGGAKRHHVHGITTAASVWLSAAVGVGTGGHLYIYSVWAVVLAVFVLRLGPRLAFHDDESYAAEPQDEEEWEEQTTEKDALEWTCRPKLHSEEKKS